MSDEAKRAARQAAIRNRDADRLEATLPRLPRPSDRPSLVVLVGLPGSGKSHFARALVARHPAAILDSDALRRVLFASPKHTQPEHARLFPAIHVLIDRLLSGGVSVIVDATNVKESSRKPYYEIARHHRAPVVVIQVRAPRAVIRERLRRREEERDALDRSTATLHVFEKMLADVDPIRRRHFTVDTSKDMNAVLDKITLALQS